MKCPICGNDNGCAISHGKDPNSCWCHTVEFPKIKLDYDTCICKDCVNKLMTEELKEEIREVEKQFMLDALKKGAEGWSKHFMSDGVMILSGKNPPVVGRDNINAFMDSVFVEGFKLKWKPEIISFSDDFSMCYSTGNYVRTVQGQEEYGKYLTIFRRENGRWKVELDIGN